MLKPRVVAQRLYFKQSHHGGFVCKIERRAVCAHRAGGIITIAFDIDLKAGDIHFNDGHLVLRERTGLIRTDDRGAAERFHGVQLLHDGIVLGHALHAKGEHDRHDRGQALGDGGDREADGGHEHFKHMFAAKKPHPKHHRADDKAAGSKELAHLGQLLLQRRILVILLLDHLRNLADYGVHARFGHNAHASAVGDKRAHKAGVDLISKAHVARELRLRVFFHRNGLTRKRGLFNLKVDGLHEPHVRRHIIAGFEHHEVPRHQFARGNGKRLAAADDLGVRCGHFLKRLERLARAVFLHDAQHGVDDDDADDNERVGYLAHDG